MSSELCGCGLRGERDRTRRERQSVRGLRPSSQCSQLTLWRRGIAVRSGRALDARPACVYGVRFECPCRRASCRARHDRFHVRASGRGRRILAERRPRAVRFYGNGNEVRFYGNGNERCTGPTGGGADHPHWLDDSQGHVLNILYAGSSWSRYESPREDERRPGHRGLISTRVPSKCPLVRPRQ